MGLFSKKKGSDQLSSLSETDIQKKLYGGLSQKQEKGAGEVGSNGHSSREIKAVSMGRDARTEDNGQDLFKQQRILEDEEAVTLEDEREERRRMARLAELAQQEESQKRAEKSRSQKSHVVSTPKVKRSKKSWTKPFLQKCGKLILFLLSQIANIVFWIGGRLLRATRSVDLRRPRVRSTLYWLIGFVALFSLFLGIHVLNVNREAAMKAPQRPAAAAPAQSDDKAEVTEQDKPEVPVRRIKSDDSVLSEASPSDTQETAKQVEEKSDSVASQEAQTTTAPGNTGTYVLQIATYTNPVDAQRVNKRFLEQGFSSFTQAITRPSGRVYHSVFIGRFQSFKKAQAFFDSFKGEEIARPFPDAFIRTLKS